MSEETKTIRYTINTGAAPAAAGLQSQRAPEMVYKASPRDALVGSLTGMVQTLSSHLGDIDDHAEIFDELMEAKRRIQVAIRLISDPQVTQ